jgi:nitroreductase
MSVIEALSKRYSCRKFKSDELPSTLISDLLVAAQKTASWCNTQPWSVHILSGDARGKVSDALVSSARAGLTSESDIAFPERYIGEYKERRKVCGLQLYSAVGIERGDDAATQDQLLENFRFFGAPHVAFISTPGELGAYGAVDCGLYISSFMLVAQELGVATIAQAALASYPEVVKRFIPISEGHNLLCGISFGYEDESHPVNSYRTERATIDSSVQFHI